jgi:hypothetical protein
VIAEFADAILLPTRGAARQNESGRSVRPVVAANAATDGHRAFDNSVLMAPGSLAFASMASGRVA